jgi:hypothetical protein
MPEDSLASAIEAFAQEMYGITDEDVCYSITEACQALADAAARIDRDVHPFYDREWPVNFEAEP